ncbi:HPP family protein [Blastococcus litoris]|uniref:CBS domain-containing protein n=1 Tax=Blastococcus litoris TaxID=2171622 RepID=UPI0013E0772A|nr:CBS domain-containing protein [Blastococcus litoris]
MQARDVMTREVVTVGPDTSAKYAAELMAGRGFAALPVVDGDHQLVGVVAEADVLADRLPPDPRLHLRRDDARADDPPPLLVRGVMTQGVRGVDPTADVSDIARLFVDERLRSVPVLERGRVVGIVSRRDLLRALVRPDAELRDDVLHLVEGYTGEVSCWDVHVTEGVATVRRTRGAPEVSAEVEDQALRTLGRTVAGVIAVRIVHDGAPGARTPDVDAPAGDRVAGQGGPR